MMSDIFISYRRSDNSHAAGRLHDALRAHLPAERIFMDVDFIPPGADFVEVLEEKVSACKVLLAVIGQGWLQAADANGRRRLDNPNDLVRIEIVAALTRKIRVVPVLVDGAIMPGAESLPDELKALARRNAVEITHGRFGSDVARLLKGLGLVIAPPTDPAQRVRAGSRESFKDIGFGPDMVVVPPGEFMMGSPGDEPERFDREGPQHRVVIPRAFAVSRCAVTRGEFEAFVRDSGHSVDGGAHIWNGKDWKLDTGASFRNPGFLQDDSHPVVCVNWDDAKAYVKWLSRKTGKDYRLLSEAEWEYAARAGTTTPFWWGKSISPDQANYDGNYTYAGGGNKGEWRQKTVPALSFQPNPWGLYQAHGNVWEWVEDCWNENYNGAPTNGSAWTTGDCGRRVVRGGSWNNSPGDLRAAYRFGYFTGRRSLSSGFRVARTLSL